MISKIRPFICLHAPLFKFLIVTSLSKRLASEPQAYQSKANPLLPSHCLEFITGSTLKQEESMARSSANAAVVLFLARSLARGSGILSRLISQPFFIIFNTASNLLQFILQARRESLLPSGLRYAQSFENDLLYLSSHPFEGVPIQCSCHYHQLDAVARGLAVKHGRPQTNTITYLHSMF